MKKVVIVTGAAGGLGQAVVATFISKGYHVIATTRSGRELQKEKFAGLEEVALDLTVEEKVEAFVKEVASKHHNIDAALLLVGGFAMGNIESTRGDDIKKMYTLNFETAYFTARPVFQQMMKQSNGGRIVFIGSKPALSGKDGKGTIAYGLSKSMLFKLSEYLNEEGKAKNVVSYVIAPSIIDTPQNRQDMPKANFSAWVKPEEIAEIIEFVCSGAGAQLRDSVLKVYGGA